MSPWCTSETVRDYPPNVTSGDPPKPSFRYRSCINEEKNSLSMTLRKLETSRTFELVPCSFIDTLDLTGSIWPTIYQVVRYSNRSLISSSPVRKFSTCTLPPSYGVKQEVQETLDEVEVTEESELGSLKEYWLFLLELESNVYQSRVPSLHVYLWFLR